MLPAYSEEAESFREEVKQFLRANLPTEWKGIGALGPADAYHFANEVWRPLLAQKGFLAPSWPREFGGGGLSELEQVILAEEFIRAGVPSGGSNDAFSIQMGGNTILHWGTEEQKSSFLPKIISGDHIWCQGYSEPDAGSDLGGLGCAATLDGDAVSYTPLRAHATAY